MLRRDLLKSLFGLPIFGMFKGAESPEEIVPMKLYRGVATLKESFSCGSLSNQLYKYKDGESGIAFSQEEIDFIGFGDRFDIRSHNNIFLSYVITTQDIT